MEKGLRILNSIENPLMPNKRGEVENYTEI